jgi:hypothetical protein
VEKKNPWNSQNEVQGLKKTEQLLWLEAVDSSYDKC